MSFGGRTVKYFVCTCFHAGIDIKQGDIINKPENEARKRQKEGRKKKEEAIDCELSLCRHLW